VVEGELVVKDKEHLRLDVDRVRARARDEARKLALRARA
jgi:hypothetical protein